MPVNDYLPAREADLLNWSNNFDALITADPAAVGLDLAQATAFAALNATWAAAFATATDPSTRGPSATVAKLTAKDAMTENARFLAGIVQAAPGVTAQQIFDLGLTVRDTEPTPVPVPVSAPGIEIISSVGRAVRIRLRDVLNPDSRAKPDGVVSAAVMSFLGSDPPAPTDMAAWTFEGVTTRTLTNINFDPTVPSGATAWLTAVWYNTTGESGPPTAPVSVQIPGTLPMAA